MPLLSFIFFTGTQRWTQVPSPVIISNRKAAPSLSHRCGSSTHVFRALLCSMLSIFGTHNAQNLCGQVLCWWPQPPVLNSPLEQFTCPYAAFTPKQRINSLLFGLSLRYCGWPATAGASNRCPLETTDSESELTSVASSTCRLFTPL